jgi:hypothetical protein
VKTGKSLYGTASEVAEKARFVIPSEARDLLFFSASKKQQIPRAKPALRNDMVRVFSAVCSTGPQQRRNQ